MTQLVLGTGNNALTLPEARQGNYTCDNMMLSTDIEMASGRIVREYRGRVYQLTYQYTYLNTAHKEALIRYAEQGQSEPITVMFLAPGGDTLQRSSFLVTEFQAPQFIWGRPGGEALWGNWKIVLREVDPHD